MIYFIKCYLFVVFTVSGVRSVGHERQTVTFRAKPT